jgi:hypothetical protein
MADFPAAAIQDLGWRVLAFLAARFLTASSATKSHSAGGICRATIFSMTALGTCLKYVPVPPMIEPPCPHHTVAARETYGENLLFILGEESTWFSAIGASGSVSVGGSGYAGLIVRIHTLQNRS